MYLLDLLFRLPPHVFVRIKFDGESEPLCFTTGERTTGKKVGELTAAGKHSVTVNEVIPLWHAEELYIHCS